jgi:cell division protein ZapA (FtsZ GTPase activity inhibitor)
VEKSVRVVIGGDEFRIKGPKGDSDIAEIAGYVDRQIAAVASGVTARERYRTAVLAALNIAGELFDARQELKENSNKLSGLQILAKDLTEKLEKAVP